MSNETVLSERQQVRIECLRAARECLGARAAFSSGPVDPIDLVNVAQYIETGQDPYEIRTPLMVQHE